VSGLYRGLQITLIHTLTNQFVYFYFYEALKPYYQRFSGKKDLETFLQVPFFLSFFLSFLGKKKE